MKAAKNAFYFLFSFRWFKPKLTITCSLAKAAFWERKVLEQYFQEYNLLHFEGALPQPRLIWNARLKSSAGRFSPGRRDDPHRPPVIEVASYLRNIPESTKHIRDTMLHEMVHYYLWHQRKPYGHTSEFKWILKKVGAQRYNTVPLRREYKHLYECPGCLKTYPARRKLAPSACLSCCQQKNQGQFTERFLLRIKTGENTVTALKPIVETPARPAAEPRLSVQEILGRLEELKNIVLKRQGPNTRLP